LPAGRFEPVLADPCADPAAVRRVILVSGKLAYALGEAGDGRVAIIRLERLHPFPGAELARAMEPFPAGAELVWAQEEPRNQGAWQFVRGCFLDGLVPGRDRPPAYAGRAPAAATGTGSHKAHLTEQADLVREAIG
jgi:2-oxoglutarate dehydrogenase E1 component